MNQRATNLAAFWRPVDCVIAAGDHRVRPRRLAAIVLGFALAFVAAAQGARAEVLSIAELNAKVEKWRAEKADPPSLRFQVEGRATLLGKNRLQFKQCKILFESPDEIPSITNRPTNFEVTGTVVRAPETGAYSFRIESASEGPSDLDTYFERRRALRRAPPEQWYALGDWAAARGEFYKDYELLARSDEAYQKGFELERQALARDNPAGLFALAETARKRHLSEKLVQELRHEAIVIEWRRTRKQTGGALKELLLETADRLAGSTDPLSHPNNELRKEYFADPLETYEKADAGTRRKLHRLLYADILLRTITPELKADGSNGFAVAESIDQQVPEYHALAEQYRDKALSARAEEVASLARSDMLDLAKQYRDRGQAAKANELIESWLRWRLQRLDADDTEGLIELTEDYRQLLKQNDVANQILIDAWQRLKAPDIAERLQQAGYRLFEGQWMTVAAYNARPEGRLEQAIRAGRVETGMTASHVRRSLGEPQHLARAATAGQITEVWTYDQSGATRLTVHLRKSRRQSELSVVEVTQSAR